MVPTPATLVSEHAKDDVYDVIIIGAGPCGLAVAARLQEETPSAMFTDEEHQRYHWIKRHSGKMALVRAHARKNKGVKADRYTRLAGDDELGRAPSPPRSCSCSPRSKYSTLVLDSSGDRWMERWNRAFRTLEIDQLRSPMFFHVDPGDRDGMLAYTRETGRERELWEISGCVGQELSKHKRKKMRAKARPPGEVEIDERDRKDYFSPSTELFADYCSSIATRYGLSKSANILQSDVHDIQFGIIPGSRDVTTQLFTVSSYKGTFLSRAVVLAIGPGHTKMLPWELSAEEQIGACHSSEIGSTTFPSVHVQKKITQGQDTNVVVVGGGLSSAQIVDMAIRKGVTRVWYIMRGDLKVKHFDVSLNWVGKFRNYEKAVFWSADDDEERIEMLQTARNGGSITPRFHKIIKQYIARQRVSLHTRTVICDKHFDPVSKTWRISTDPPIPGFPPCIDHIYFATGMKTDIGKMPLLRSMHRDYPIESLHGLPCLTDDLMWRADVPLFVTGRLAALRLGPAGPNLEGARLGAERVAWALQDMFRTEDVENEHGRNPAGSLQTAFCGLGNRYAGLVDA